MDTAYPCLVAAPVIGLAADCAAHIVAARLARGPNPYVALMCGIVAGLFAAGIVSGLALHALAASFGDVVGYGLLNLATYLSLAWCYFHFVNLSIASLRIRILHEIATAGGAITAARLRERYNTESMISLRIDRLCDGGYLVRREGRFYSGRAKFLIVARLFDGLRSFILGPNYLRPSSSSRAPAGGDGVAVETRHE